MSHSEMKNSVIGWFLDGSLLFPDELTNIFSFIKLLSGLSATFFWTSVVLNDVKGFSSTEICHKETSINTSFCDNKA